MYQTYLRQQWHKQDFQQSFLLVQLASESLPPRNQGSAVHSEYREQGKFAMMDSWSPTKSSTNKYLSPCFHGIWKACRLIWSPKTKKINSIDSIILGQCLDIPEKNPKFVGGEILSSIKWLLFYCVNEK